MLRDRFHNILKSSIVKYIEAVDPEIGDTIFSMPIEADGDIYAYSLEVSKIEEFPVFICMGGNKPPREGCHKIITQNHLNELTNSGIKERDRPITCDFCGNTEFDKIESEEELRERYYED